MSNKSKHSQVELAFICTITGVIILAYAQTKLDAHYTKEDAAIIQQRSLNQTQKEPEPFHYIPIGPDPSRKTTQDPDILFMDEDEFKDYMRDYLGEEYDLTPREYEREQRR